MGYTLGLDIGIASVGFGLIDNVDGKILESGVRLFSSADPDNNQTRRSSRQARRLNRASFRTSCALVRRGWF